MEKLANSDEKTPMNQFPEGGKSISIVCIKQHSYQARKRREGKEKKGGDGTKGKIQNKTVRKRKGTFVTRGSRSKKVKLSLDGTNSCATYSDTNAP